MTRKINKPLVDIPVSIEKDGKTYHGSYTLDRGIICVSNMLGSKTTQLGGLPPETLAKMLLSELVHQGKA